MTVRLAADPGEASDAVGVRAAAKAIGCDPSTVRKLIRRGQLAAHHAGLGTKRRSYRISRAAIEDYKIRNDAAADPALPQPRRTRGDGAHHREAVAALARLGLRF